MRIEPPLLLPPLALPERPGATLVAAPSSAPEEVVRTGEVLPAGNLPDQSWRLVAAYAAPPVSRPRAVAAYQAAAAAPPQPPLVDLYA